MLKKTKQNKTKQQQQKKNGVHSEIRNIEKKIKKQEKTIKTRILGVNSLSLLFWHSSENSVSISVY